MRHCRLLFVSGLLWLGCVSIPAFANDADVDYLELAARLIADGNYQRAGAALGNLDPEAGDLDRARYYTLTGLVALRRERLDSAITALARALEEFARLPETSDKGIVRERKKDQERVQLYLAQAHMRQESYAQALEALNAAGETGAAIAMVHALRAQAHWELEQYVAAFDALDRGQARFPEDTRFLRRKVFYLIHLGLYQHAADQGQRYLSQAQAAPEDYVAIGGSLRKSGQHRTALGILERARLVYPRDHDIAVELAHTWLASDQLSAAADVLADAALQHPGLRLEAAELQRRAGRSYRALLLNSAIADQPAKYRQRIALLVALEHWDQAAAMEDALRRNGLMDDDDIRYALAYAQFRAGQYKGAERILAGIGGGESFRRATELRKAINRCQEESWQCI